jgi:hypothetical protein
MQMSPFDDRFVRDLKAMWEYSLMVPSKPQKPVQALAELLGTSSDPSFAFSMATRPSLSDELLEEPEEPTFFDAILKAMALRGLNVPQRPHLPPKPPSMSESRYMELIMKHVKL